MIYEVFGESSETILWIIGYIWLTAAIKYSIYTMDQVDMDSSLFRAILGLGPTTTTTSR